MFKKSLSIAARTAPAAIMAAVVALMGVTSVSAQVDEPGDTCISVDFGGTRLIRKVQKVVEFTPIAAIDIPAGPVTIPRATSTDVYDNRINVTQLSELWEVQFIGADGSVIATSGLTEDLPDRVVSGFWEGPITGVTLTEPAVGIRAHHRPEFTTFDTPESVRASGVEVCFPTQVTTTTTSTSTTSTTTTSTTEPTTSSSSSTSSSSTTSTTLPTTTTTTTSTSTTVCDSTTTTDPGDSTTTTDPEGPSTTPPDPCGPTITTSTSSTTSTTAISTTTTRPPGTSVQTPPPSGPTTIPVTGSETSTLVFPAALMLLAGLGLVIVSKRPA